MAGGCRLALLLCAVALGLSAQAADASQIRGWSDTRAGTWLAYVGAPGEANGVTVTPTASRTLVTVSDPGILIESPVPPGVRPQPLGQLPVVDPVCTPGLSVSVCASTGATFGYFDLGDGNDTLSVVQPLGYIRAFGGPGDDDIIVEGSAALIGGPGADRLAGWDDPANPDDHRAVDYGDHGTQPVNVSLDNVANDGATGEGDNVFDSIDFVVAAKGDDVLAAGSRPVGFWAGDGNDILRGGPGADALNGENGDDRIEARDGVKDYVSCGDGNDTAIVDALDVVYDCETVVVG